MSSCRATNAKPIHSAVCPCCACSLVELARANAHPKAPLVWQCWHCGYSLMGLAIPVRPENWKDYMPRTCLEIYEATRVTSRGGVNFS